MPERDALIAAICANPEDDTPRLVFADWLDENEPDAKPRGKKATRSPSSWASLIRAECELARLQADGSAAAAIYDFCLENDEPTLTGVRWERVLPDVGRRVELAAAAKKLRRAAAKARNRGLPRESAIGAALSEDTHRGFPGGVWIHDSDKFLKHIDTLASSCPRLRVIFMPGSPGELAARGVLRWCREAYVTGNHRERVRVMSREPDAACVRSLSLQGGPPAAVEESAKALAESPHWSGLRELALGDYFRLSAELGARLLRAKHLHRLTKLDVTGSSWTADALAGLDHFTELRSLRLTHSSLGDDAARRLASLPGLANLRRLDLTGNRIGGAGCSALLASPHLKNLVALDLTRNRVRGVDPKALANAPAGGLRVLGLQHCRLTAADVVAITRSPRTSELMYFAICGNRLPESAVELMVKGFGDRAPAVLYLMQSGIGNAGVEAIANWPAATQIDMLHLEGNHLPTKAAKAIAASPHLKGLTHLCAGVAHSAGRAALRTCFGARAHV